MKHSSSSTSVGPNVNRLGASNNSGHRGKSNSQVGSQNTGTRPKGKRSNSTTGPVTDKCTACGRNGHKFGDSKCPARDKECHNCKKQHHFASQCWSKVNNSGNRVNNSNRSTRGKTVNCLETEESSTEEGKGAFACKTHANFRFDKVVLNVGGVDLDVLVDSGSECNIIGIDTWNRLQSLGIRADIRETDIKLFPYTIDKPLSVHACFNAKITAGDNSTTADFIIISDKGQPSLLGLTTARELGVLKIGINLDVNKVNQCKYASLLENYSDLFSGIGKYKGAQVKIAVNPDVTPVAQSFRRIPFALRDKVEAKLKSLEEQDIIETVHEPTPWVSPLVVVPKANGDIRLCVDMRLANQAIIRERHPIPTVEVLLCDMNSSRIFSKIDMREGFSQLVLHPDSLSITTFASHVGLFRYKRLNYGTCSAPERYQAEIQRLVQGFPGVANLADDIIVHGSDKTEHDDRLVKLLDRLKNAGLTLNGDKCKFGVDELEFVGHKLSAQGIDAATAKVESIVNTREPQTVGELRSFLGLLNYVSKFILQYSTKTEPLRRLTRKNTKFVFGKEQKDAFRSLKRDLASSETLGYFDLKYPTKVIADASPVGLGAVLVQIQEDGPRIISYASRSLTDVEQRYCQTEREALSLVWACEKFRAYLLGIQFDLVTDHSHRKQ